MTDIRFRSSASVELIDHMGSDTRIVQAARASTKGADSRDDDATFGFINSMMRDRHGSVVEHNVFTFLIECPIFTARQIMRHRMASFNELSGRYAKARPEFYVIPEGRALTQEGRPGAYTYMPGSPEQATLVREAQETSARQAWEQYDALLDAGIAREVARMYLPLSMYTAFFMTVNLRSLLNFLSLRGSEEGHFPSFPQAEVADVSDQMEAIFQELMPTAHAAFIANKRVAP